MKNLLWTLVLFPAVAFAQLKGPPDDIFRLDKIFRTPFAERTVQVVSSTGKKCAGTVLANGTILTASDCVSEKDNYVDGKEADILRNEGDFAILIAHKLFLREAEVAKPRVWDEVFWINPGGEVAKGRILYVSSTEVLVNTALPEEFSGGGIFKSDGKLVAVYRAFPGMSETGAVYATARRADRLDILEEKRGR